MSTQPRYIRVALHMARAENFSTLLPRIPTREELSRRAHRTRAALIAVVFVAILLSMPAWSATLTPVVYPQSQVITSAHLALGKLPPSSAADYRLNVSATVQKIQKINAHETMNDISRQAVLEHLAWLTDNEGKVKIVEFERIGHPAMSEEDIYPLYLAAAVDKSDRFLMTRWMDLFDILDTAYRNSSLSARRFVAHTKFGISTGLVLLDRSTLEIGTSALTQSK